MDQVFRRLGIVYFLTYGSLFGALRYGGPLPWDTDADVGVLKESIERYSLEQLQFEFKKYHVHVSLDVAKGTYHFGRANVSADGFIFKDLSQIGWMRRDASDGGWLRALKYLIHHGFPARLVTLPLPQRKFGKAMVYVPRGGFEILKYHYRGGWETESPPVNCGRVGLAYLHNFTTSLYGGGPQCTV